MREILSASKIKTLEGCSWIYYCKYVLKMPDSSNSGSIMGTACHLVFECLGKKRRKKLLEKVKRNKTIKRTGSIVKLCERSLKKDGMSLEDMVADYKGNPMSTLDLIDKMVVKGLNHDFHCKGSTESLSEQAFLIEKDEDGKRYKIRGFIDKMFLFKSKKRIVIRDFKSSKKKFEGKEVEDNIQDLTYRLASKHLFPEYKEREMEFVFLQHEEFLVKTGNVCDKELDGFEHCLTAIQDVVDNFDENMAMQGLAADKGYLPESEGFAGRLMCSRAEYPNQKKVNGEPYWACSMKFAYHYYALCDKDGNVIKTSKTDGVLKAKEGERIEKKLYAGCPAFQYLPYNKEFLAKNS